VKASQGIEIEKKYDVGDDATVPPMDELPGVARVGTPHTAVLEAVYFDTERHTLASRRITLRRRTGGIDAGWHLKLPPEAASGSEPEQRRELHAPLGQPGVVPESLLAHVRAYLRGTEVAPVVRLQTRRTTHALYGGDGVHLADLADDVVEATRLHHGAAGEQPQRWREWELELVHGSADLFGPAEQLLAAAGARPAGHASKLARALGKGSGSTALEEQESPALLAGKKAPAAAVVTVYVAEQLRHILAQDAAVRQEEAEAIHSMRSAVRRIRSVLAAYRKLYSAVPVRRLRDELGWLGELLGDPRDSEVVLERLRGHLEHLPAGEGTDAARELAQRKAGAAFDAGYRRLQEALQSERYFRLLDGLEEFRDHPPVRSAAVAPGLKVTAKAVDKAASRLRRSHKAASHARRGTDHENALHQVRKDAKRLRHVAESAALLKGKRARKVAKAAHRQQKILGDFHDAMIARNLLQDLEPAHGLPEPTAAALAALGTGQAELMDAAEAKYRKARKKSRDVLRRGVL
jgi:CHAD domain-containing protein